MSTIKSLWYRVSGKKRRDERNRADALAGRTTSAYLEPGERDRLFRQEKERRQRRISRWR